MTNKVVKIAVVGHTNTGKTSLMRTLTRDPTFGKVADGPGVTLAVEGVELYDVDGKPVLELYDTPGLQNAPALMAYLEAKRVAHPDPVAEITAFVDGDHDGGNYEQEARVLRQVLRSDAAIYVVDVTEPVLDKHRKELQLLAKCGRPLMPVLNFVASNQTNSQEWRDLFPLFNLHIHAEFDAVVYDHVAERIVFDELGNLLKSKGRRNNFERLIAARKQQRSELIDEACRAIAELLVNAAAARVQCDAGQPVEQEAIHLKELVSSAEQECVKSLLETFKFELNAHVRPDLPLEHDRWKLNPFDPQTAKKYGIELAKGAGKGAAIGAAVDAATGLATLGVATLLGAIAGVAWDFGPRALAWIYRMRSRQQLHVVADITLAVLAARQIELLRALLTRGHATQRPLPAMKAEGWPSSKVRKLTLRCRFRPEWSALNADLPTKGRLPDEALKPIMRAIREIIDQNEKPPVSLDQG